MSPLSFLPFYPKPASFFFVAGEFHPVKPSRCYRARDNESLFYSAHRWSRWCTSFEPRLLLGMVWHGHHGIEAFFFLFGRRPPSLQTVALWSNLLTGKIEQLRSNIRSRVRGMIRAEDSLHALVRSVRRRFFPPMRETDIQTRPSYRNASRCQSFLNQLKQGI